MWRGFPHITQLGSSRQLPEATPVRNALGKGPAHGHFLGQKGAVKTGEQACGSATTSRDPAAGQRGRAGLQEPARPRSWRHLTKALT